MTNPQAPQPKDGGPAFPGLKLTAAYGSMTSAQGSELTPIGGMALRDYFAARAGETDIAVQAEIIRAQLLAAGKLGILPDDYRVIARYMHADAMLKVRGEAR